MNAGLSTSLLIKGALFTSEFAHHKEGSQAHFFIEVEAAFSPEKLSLSLKFASHKWHARGHSLDRGSPVSGKRNHPLSLCLSHTHSLSSWLYLLSSVACLPNLSKSVLHLSSFGVNEGTPALHLSFSLTRGLLLDMSPWSHIKSDNTWTVQIEVPRGVSGYWSHSS